MNLDGGTSNIAGQWEFIGQCQEEMGCYDHKDMSGGSVRVCGRIETWDLREERPVGLTTDIGGVGDLDLVKWQVPLQSREIEKKSEFKGFEWIITEWHSQGTSSYLYLSTELGAIIQLSKSLTH